MTGDPWYRIADLLPPLGVRVRVMWDGREFEAARVLHPVNKRACWVTHDRRLGAVFLPLEERLRRPNDPGTPWVGWHTLYGNMPDYYQPLRPDLWSVPLPPPVMFREAPSLMWSATPRKTSETGLETITETTGAVPGGGSDDRGSGQWWRDPLAIVYAPSGHVTRVMAEGRVMRAVAVCGDDDYLTMTARTPNDLLAEIQRYIAALDAKVDSGPLERFVALPQDAQDFEIAMRWFMQLNTPESWSRRRRLWSYNRPQRVLRWRARMVPLSFAEIGFELRVSPQRARQLYDAAIDVCWHTANGAPTSAEVLIEDVRVRSRRHKRKAFAE